MNHYSARRIITYACAVYSRCESACGTKTTAGHSTRNQPSIYAKEGREDFRSFITFVTIVFSDNADPSRFLRRAGGLSPLVVWSTFSPAGKKRRKKKREKNLRAPLRYRSQIADASGFRITRAHNDDLRLIGHVTKLFRAAPFCLSPPLPSLLPLRRNEVRYVRQEARRREDEQNGFQAGSEPLLDFCTSATSPHASPPMKQRKAARREIAANSHLASLREIWR